MTTMSLTTIVMPKSARHETLAVGFVILVIALIAGVAISQRQIVNPLPRLYDWQLSSFYDLNKADQAIHSSLISAIPELWLLHADKIAQKPGAKVPDAWPSVSELAEYYFVAPFAKDLFWSQYGQVNWARVTTYSFEGSTVYHGHGGSADQQSAYLVVLSHAHKGASFSSAGTIWINANANAPAPNEVVRDSLIRKGWKQVVAYSGEMERKRIRS
jgi:uncharacterized protein DUF6162